jgi:hypothetical protein
MQTAASHDLRKISRFHTTQAPTARPVGPVWVETTPKSDVEEHRLVVTLQAQIEPIDRLATDTDVR